MWMTASALRELEAEQAELENAGRELSQLEQARLIELRALIAGADTSAKPDDGLVEPGMRVTVRFRDDSEEEFLLSNRTVDDAQTVSLDSPIGSAINGHHVGDEVSYTTAAGATQAITITAVTPHA